MTLLKEAITFLYQHVIGNPITCAGFSRLIYYRGIQGIAAYDFYV